MNMDDKDYIGEEEGGEDMSSTVDSVKDVAKDRKRIENVQSERLKSKVITLVLGQTKRRKAVQSRLSSSPAMRWHQERQ